jgi:cytochrome oxidase Cu insertion factor (SCO1/SenC/PrrC family)
MNRASSRNFERNLRAACCLWAVAAIGIMSGCSGPMLEKGPGREVIDDAESRANDPGLISKTNSADLSLPNLTITPWRDKDVRSTSFPLGFKLLDQDGHPWDPQSLQGKPFVTTFLYTRCENPNKCPLVARTLGKLQSLIRGHSLEGSVALVLITYDPEYDSAARLREFSIQHSIQTQSNLWLIRPDAAEKKRFFESMNVAVNFNQRDVNAHRIELMLFDSQSRFVRSYHSILWDNEAVLADLSRVLKE